MFYRVSGCIDKSSESGIIKIDRWVELLSIRCSAAFCLADGGR